MGYLNNSAFLPLATEDGNHQLFKTHHTMIPGRIPKDSIKSTRKMYIIFKDSSIYGKPVGMDICIASGYDLKVNVDPDVLIVILKGVGYKKTKLRIKNSRFVD